ncbi:nucleotidyltransferase domain-containing protein [Paenibacillus cremeus]|uniref:Nucleotidyltransferase domain-containing protein n=1 Tax=Paenibacillus cremeus TaxID=2163881 RepID=A0A559KI88_9BACL|nr:nucleotidyltransferase domain-containing protein [Paenibacillus cremeus]TVY11853.1 nucleotidyltransferase domain-containing protein [Paenibacillus cremeus]
MNTLSPSKIPTLTDMEKKSISKLKERIAVLFKLKSMILFGSKARGDYEEWSDVDLLILVDEEKNWSNREKLSDITLDINMEFDTQLTCILENATNWEMESVWLPLKDNIIQEGIAIEI